MSPLASQSRRDKGLGKKLGHKPIHTKPTFVPIHAGTGLIPSFVQTTAIGTRGNPPFLA
jgi:hypothetical protein